MEVVTPPFTRGSSHRAAPSVNIDVSMLRTKPLVVAYPIAVEEIFSVTIAKVAADVSSESA